MQAEAQVEPLLALGGEPSDPTGSASGCWPGWLTCAQRKLAQISATGLDEVEAVFLALVREAERDIRARLAERLARADWAPVALIETLARDDIEVARPVIAASPLLKDEALVRLLTEATLAHHIEVAQRPAFPPPWSARRSIRPSPPC